MKAIYQLLLLSLVIYISACQTATAPPYSSQKAIAVDSAAVVTAHPLASEVGEAILRAGGNAVDAAIAVQFALAVVCPRAGNIGGGGFMVLRQKDGSVNSLDFREKAPLAATRDMYLDSLGNPVSDWSQKGHSSVGVPGSVAGMVAAYEKYGSTPTFGELVQPAINLAAKGFPISQSEAERLNSYANAFKAYNTTDNPFLKNALWKAGDVLVQANLAHTLERIRDKGHAGFYAGATADLLVAEMQRGNGLITHQDLQTYQAIWRTPVTGEVDAYRIISMPPPSSGGVALLQILEMVEDYPLHQYDWYSAERMHLIIEAERRAYADRAEHLGDMDFVEVPLDTLLSPMYARARMKDFDPTTATVSDSILAGAFQPTPESFETTHFSIVDPFGNAVAITTTLNLNYGSKVLVHGAGFFLNDEMDDFSAKPGTPNYFGLVGAEANAIAPAKRMLSSMSTTIIEKNGKLWLVLGSPGGSTIITSVFQVFSNMAEHGMTLEEAVNAPRFHHQWLPNTIMVEGDKFPDTLLKTLTDMGHTIDEKGRLGLVKAIHKSEDGKLYGVGDPRNADDDAAGF